MALVLPTYVSIYAFVLTAPAPPTPLPLAGFALSPPLPLVRAPKVALCKLTGATTWGLDQNFLTGRLPSELGLLAGVTVGPRARSRKGWGGESTRGCYGGDPQGIARLGGRT